MSWVLPSILQASDVVGLPDEALVALTKISTDIILEYVNDFIAANIDSADNTDATAARRLQSAYAVINKTNEYLKSKDAKDFADTLANLQYSDVNYGVDLEVLKQWRSQIIDLLAEDEDFRESYTGDIDDSETRGMKTAYTTRLDKDNLESVIAELCSIGITTGTTRITTTLIDNIKKHSGLFKNGNYNLNSPTVMRRAIYKKDKLATILRGLNFIIPRKEAGLSANEWRKL